MPTKTKVKSTIKTPVKASTLPTFTDAESVKKYMLELDVKNAEALKNAPTKPSLAQKPTINQLASKKILDAYPTFKQMNTLMFGVAADIKIMKTFISKVVLWSNSPNPKIADLDLIA